MDDRFDRLRREIARWIDEQDADLMIAGSIPSELLIASLSEAGLSQDEAGLVRSALLVRRYELSRDGAGASDEAKLITEWIATTFPVGVSSDYPYQYLLEDPQK